MTNQQAAIVKLETQIGLYEFSLSNTRDPIMEIKLRNAIAKLNTRLSEVERAI